MYLLFDIGGTKMRVAVSDGETVGAAKTAPTPAAYADGLTQLVAFARELAGDAGVSAVCGGIAGPFSERTSSLVGSPNLSGWIGKPLLDDLRRELGAPVHIENDSAMCGLGEAVYGAGRGFGIVAYITVSTGVGGARIVNGAIDEKSIGFEPGHQIIDVDMSIDSTVRGLNLERYISGRGVLDRTGKRPEEIEDPAFWERLAEYLAFGLNNTIVHWSPDAVVVGGSMITGGERSIPLAPAEAKLRSILTIYPELPAIRRAELGDASGLWGALGYLKRKSA